jgi:hypothetical protein
VLVETGAEANTRRWILHPSTAGRIGSAPETYSANAVSQFGNAMAVVAIAWLALETKGSAAQTGLTDVALFLQNVSRLVFGGAILDRPSPRRSGVLADTFAGLTIPRA